jgi:hypothetical protein
MFRVEFTYSESGGVSPTSPTSGDMGHPMFRVELLTVNLALLSPMSLSLPPQNVPLSRVDKLRRDEEDGEDTAEGLHA